MKKKRLISLMLSGVMATSVATLVGCDNKVEENIGYSQYKNVYIVLDQKGQEVLHKGDFYDGVKDSDNKFALDCMNGNHILTNKNYLVMENHPTEEYYDEICENCFNK